jgi:hypothetical protein
MTMIDAIDQIINHIVKKYTWDNLEKLTQFSLAEGFDSFIWATKNNKVTGDKENIAMALAFLKSAIEDASEEHKEVEECPIFLHSDWYGWDICLVMGHVRWAEGQ